MKKLILIFLCLVLSNIIIAQVTITKSNGGSVITKLGMGISVNAGSSLTREWIIINDAKCPLQLNSNIGIEVVYLNSNYSFKQVGSITTKKPIAAYELHLVLYDVFGKHIKTLENVNISDINGVIDISKSGRWHANENQVSEFLTCVAYIATVRTGDGELWSCDFQSIKEELNKIQINYDKDYSPKPPKDDK